MDYPRRKINRLHNYNYSAKGAYFLTICAQGKHPIFGRVVGDDICEPRITLLTPTGKIVDNQLATMAHHNPAVTLGDYVIMPNHIHLIVWVGQGLSGASGTPPPTPANQTVPAFVSTLKRLTNRAAGRNLWQRGYYDHILRDEPDYLKIANYIQTNPARWRQDCFYCE